MKVETKVDTPQKITLAEAETQSLLDWAIAIEHSELTFFEKAKMLATRLGAHYRADGLTEVGFWTPRLSAQVMRKSEIYFEVLTPLEAIDTHIDEQVIPFRRDRLNLKQQGEFHWGVVAGMTPGDRDRIGSFYWLRYIDQAGQLQAIRDTIPYSLPYGVFGPAELYDIDKLQAQRQDLEYFRRTGASQMPALDSVPALRRIPRIRAPRNILQIHVGTSSPERSIAGLNRLYQGIAEKIANDIPLTPAEKCYIGYDAIQFLPTEPTIEFRDEYSPESEFFSFHDEEDEVVNIELNKPSTQDWGYDVPILGSSATNPALLESLRPDEVVDLIATLHNFPTGPIQIIYDLVYGHADNQSELLLHRQFLKGPNMYGQDLNHQLPIVRAIFLEMQRRKINTGVDGIRVDGGQDFRFFNPLTGLVEYDDAYLVAMSDVIQEIDGHQRLLFTIFEDGRPWPAEGWEDISTYRELIELKPDSFQWGPLIFAHNTPTLKGFWERKWRRVCEVMYEGSHWITGCANHDTVRRGNQVDPTEDINWNLGKSLPEVLRNGYDNAAVTLWVYGFSPGLPMDFINATMHAPWMFFRNTDERYGVKVVSEEFGFLDWQITPQVYKQSWAFKRLKTLGFRNLQDLQEFGKALQYLMLDKEYNLNEVVEAFRICAEDNEATCEVPNLLQKSRSNVRRFWSKLDLDRLKRFALMFMEDCYEVCNVSHYQNNVKEISASFNLSLRYFRHERPWLRENLTGTDRFNKTGGKQATVYYGVRSNPDNERERVAMVAHMGGDAVTVKLGEWLQLDLEEWEVAIASEGLKVKKLDELTLQDSQGLLLVSKLPQGEEKPSKA
ncbi:MAG: glucosylglycerol hydrolase [Jaaginema sp. PMC 1079.18]|nr:glucosylglycerol hydrolase [Jaaginema sp. PMC 1080.18]MEC4850312.1 glucosylglycerol hydrolase [Jaaginema sp. PMC 1079.18]MEC4865977.1 glucosylglycerol hydrolase [Jaaginema sp. PMC 1078.18]